MTEQKSPLEQALDLFVYAPIGLALTAREELPKLVEKGRSRVTGQVMMARMMGQFAVAQGQKEAEKAIKRYMAPPRPESPAQPEATAAPVATQAAPAPASEAAAPASSPAAPVSPAAPATSNGGGVPAVEHLAIPGYDALSASQVVQRLAGLSGEELEAVARYESATRHRKTILTRVSQLQTA